MYSRRIEAPSPQEFEEEEEVRDYTKQNKAVFLSDGRCVFEEDAPKYEEQQKKREELLASKEIPVMRGSTYSNATTRYFELPKGGGLAREVFREWVGNREVKEFRIGEMKVTADSTLRPDQGYFISENAKNAEFNKPRVLRNCENCGLFEKWPNYTLMRPCAGPIRNGTVWREALKWRMENLESDHGTYCGVKPGADNCPGWKERE